jgi:hypothetical protein
MIEEELKQDAEKSLDKRLGTYAYIRKQDCYTNYVDGYIDGAEPREKRIKELEKDKQYLSDSLDKQIEATLKLDKENAELEAQNKELQCCANCRHSYGGEEEPFHDCGYCHAMQCICKLKLEEHTSDIYRMWEDKCNKWEMRVN